MSEKKYPPAPEPQSGAPGPEIKKLGVNPLTGLPAPDAFEDEPTNPATDDIATRPERPLRPR